ncbi:MAG: DUF1949 domain-containing protein, partial [Nocardioides sp.]|nr:DUF1949 domain-containing protein [Nocardioides sp.]
RAYGDAVRAGLDAAGTLRRDLLHELVLDLDHTDAGRVESELRQRGVAVLEVAYAETVTLTVGVAPTDVPGLEATLAELSAGTLVAVPSGERWVDRLTP